MLWVYDHHPHGMTLTLKVNQSQNSHTTVCSKNCKTHISLNSSPIFIRQNCTGIVLNFSTLYIITPTHNSHFLCCSKNNMTHIPPNFSPILNVKVALESC